MSLFFFVWAVTAYFMLAGLNYVRDFLELLK